MQAAPPIKSKSEAPISSSRVNLLDAIRGMDVSKLRSSQEESIETEKAATKKAVEPVGILKNLSYWHSLASILIVGSTFSLADEYP